ncbi:MAG: DNA repair protein RecO [Bacillota bacterium]|nr:DNA repair protein RecO [Bacillota bacterium]
MASSEKIFRKGIVVSISEIKEADAMVNAIDADGYFSFYARGARKIGGKSLSALQPLTYSSFSLSKQASGKLALHEAEAIENYLKSDDLACLASLTLIQELTSKLVRENEAAVAYPWLSAALSQIKSGYSPLSAALIYFCSLLKLFGLGLDVDECVYCQSKKGISGLSFEEGGFLCADHLYEGGGHKMEPRKLKIYRYIFRVPLEQFGSASFTDKECVEILNELGSYLAEQTGFHLSSLKIIEKLAD